MRNSNLPSLSRPNPACSEISVGLPIDTDHLSPQQTKNLIHELQVHQIELKLQNEELRRIQGELETSHARYFDLYDLAPVGYITVDESGLILEGNLVAATMLDVPKGTIVKQPLTRFIFKEDQDLYYQHRKQLFGTGGPRTLELRMVKKDGSRFWVRLDSIVVRNADKTVVCRAVVSDITERKRGEEREQLSRDVLELLNRSDNIMQSISEIVKLVKKSTGFEAVGIRLRDGDDFPYYETNGFPGHFVEAERRLCAYDEKGKVIRDKAGNPVLECMCGNVIRGRTDPAKPFFTEGGSFWSNGTTKLLASTTEKDRQARTRNRCNGEGYESVALIPLSAGKDTIGLLQFNDHRKGRFTIEAIQFFEGLGAAIGIALTRVLAVKLLKESEEKFRILFEQAADIILQLEIKPDGMPVIREVNKAALKLLGYERDELIGKPVTFLNPSSDDASIVIERRQTVVSGSGTIFEAKHRCKDGTIRDFECSGSEIQVGSKIFAITVERDITERKCLKKEKVDLQAQLNQSQKLEAIGQLSSGVAHDFNNLLGGIMGHAELLKMELNPESPLLHHPEVIISSCEKAAGLTRQLLSFARKAPVELQKIDFNVFLNQVVGLMDRTIDRRIEIVTDIQEKPAFISGDRNQLENALLNIAINARDAMPEGGHLCISSKTVGLNKTALPDEHGEVVEGAYVRITLADTGTGMSKEIRERIFEPFFTTKEVGKGTGLGLASVYGCVKQHNGYIAVDSQEGKGTQFNLYFPIAGSSEPVSGQRSEILVHGKGTLLVVDDEPVFHEILTKIFTGLGYGVRCCAGGAEAVEYYREHASGIAVVILDINMPKMSGLQCFRHLKEINPGVRVIVASGYGENRDREEMQKQGVRFFAQKPYKAAELSVKIAELANASPRSPQGGGYADRSRTREPEWSPYRNSNTLPCNRH